MNVGSEHTFYLEVDVKTLIPKTLVKIQEVSQRIPTCLKQLYPGHPDFEQIINLIPQDFIDYLHDDFVGMPNEELIMLYTGCKIISDDSKFSNLQPALGILAATLETHIDGRGIAIQKSSIKSKNIN